MAQAETINLMNSYLREQSQHIQYAGEKTESWISGGGFFQGDVWSSLLYNIATCWHTNVKDIGNSSKFIDDKMEVVIGPKSEIDTIILQKINKKGQYCKPAA